MNAPPPPGQFPGSAATIPRFRAAGDVTLDLAHRDGRVDDCWLALTPREFALLWRLAEQPGARLSDAQWLAEVWRIPSGPDSDSLAVHIARVRAKLEPLGLAGLIAAHPDGGYALDVPPAAGLLGTWP